MVTHGKHEETFVRGSVTRPLPAKQVITLAAVHREAPGRDVRVAAQGLHAESEVLATEGLKVSAGQRVGCEEFAGQKEPATQGVHVDGAEAPGKAL